jgi:hypothetical protein
MEHRKVKAALILAFCVVVVGGVVLAEGSAGGTAGATDTSKSVVDDWLSGFRNPWPGVEMGLDMRLRSITSRNIITLDSDAKNNKWNFQRYRFRWWTKWALDEDIDFNTRLVWEFRTWDEPGSKPQHTNFDEALFDHFNFTIRNMFEMPLTAVIGRQDLILGKGWLVLDGTPLDGSRTIFTDAARFTYNCEASKTKFDMIYIDQAASAARWLKPINDRNSSLTEQDEYGAILYVTNNSMEKTQLEAYFMYKNDNPVNHTPKNFPAAWSKKAEIYTYGGAISGDLDENWKYRAEGAIQSGHKDDATKDLSSGKTRDLRAYGANTSLSYHLKDKHENSFHVGYEYNSGDDPDTMDNEQFDLLWAEWPRWSELYIYTYSSETMIAESTNLHRANIGHIFKPNKVWEICTDYHLLWADENTMQGSSRFSEHSNFRGQLLTCWAKYKFNKQLYGHLLGEYLIPGSYYQQSNRDAAFFLRFNLEYRF